ncbi:MAG: hypothetical protein R3336_10470, partial [Phycisphaeraceae bacterium]|nr:hypothetical protein [Phycisphaeraceae bacterium]
MAQWLEDHPEEHDHLKARAEQIRQTGDLLERAFTREHQGEQLDDARKAAITRRAHQTHRPLTFPIGHLAAGLAAAAALAMAIVYWPPAPTAYPPSDSASGPSLAMNEEMTDQKKQSENHQFRGESAAAPEPAPESLSTRRKSLTREVDEMARGVEKDDVAEAAAKELAQSADTQSHRLAGGAREGKFGDNDAPSPGTAGANRRLALGTGGSTMPRARLLKPGAPLTGRRQLANSASSVADSSAIGSPVPQDSELAPDSVEDKLEARDEVTASGATESAVRSRQAPAPIRSMTTHGPITAEVEISASPWHADRRLLRVAIATGPGIKAVHDVQTVIRWLPPRLAYIAGRNQPVTLADEADRLAPGIRAENL